MSLASESDFTAGPSHLAGLTRLCFSRDGERIYTGGTDALVRVHNPQNLDEEPDLIDDHREGITCLECSNDRLLTGSEDGRVRSFEGPESKFDKFDTYITSAGGVPIRWIAVSKNGERVAVCSDEMIVKIVDIKETTKTTLITFQKPMRSVSWHPNNEIIAVTSTDGKIYIYELLTTGPSCLKVIDGMIAPGTLEQEIPGAVAWHPSGDYFVVGTKGHDIALVDRDGWEKKGTFSTDGHDSEIGLLAWSPNGKYLVSTGKDDQIIVWETGKRQPVSRYKSKDGLITSIAFSPTSNLLAFSNLSGSFFTWNSPIPADHPHPARAAGPQKRLVDLDDDVDMDGGLFGDEEEGEDLADYEKDDWIIDDEEREGGVKYGGREGSVGGYEGGAKEVVSITRAQTAFQPGSTTMKGKKQYLAFNMIGVIDVTDQETHHVINVEFHDKMARRGYHFQDHSKYSVAGLGERGIVYGAKAEDGQPSSIHYRAYDAWASQSDWQISLPKGEEVVLVASGGKQAASEYEEDDGTGSVIVATSLGYIRFFSGSGLQRYIWRIAEEMISIVAGQDQVMLVHREGSTSLDGCQNLRYTLIDLENFELVQEGRLPLAKKTTLSWIGFTSYQAPAMFDSNGLLSVLDRSLQPGQARWVPVLDSNMLERKQGKDESYWPVGVSDSQFMCVILKGSEKEPYFPRPLVLDLEMHMPLLNMDVVQGQLEEKLVRGNLQLGMLRQTLPKNPDQAYEVQQREISLDKELLQLVQAACKADKLQRALDVVRLMHHATTVDAASKVAAFYHLPGLQEKIGLVREAMEDKKREKEEAQRRQSRRSYGYESTSAAPQAISNARFGMEFAPKSNLTSRRTAAAVVPTESAESSYAEREESFVAETPEVETDPRISRRISPSSEGKRKRVEESAEVEEIESGYPSKKTFPMDPPKAVSKNPFARKAAPPSNPFAKASAKPTNALKSTSFFELVDNIELKEKSKGKAGKVKQTTLFGMAAPDPEKVKAAKVKAKAAPKSAEPADEEEPSADATEEGTAEEQDEDLEDTQVSPVKKRKSEAAQKGGDGDEDDVMGEDEWPASDEETEEEAESPEAMDEEDEEASPPPATAAEPAGKDKLAKFRMAAVAA